MLLHYTKGHNLLLPLWSCTQGWNPMIIYYIVTRYKILPKYSFYGYFVSLQVLIEV